MRVYWIKHKKHTDILTEGYIGITTTCGKGNRLWSHFNKLGHGSHPNPKLQNAYNKYGKEVIWKVIFEGSELECVDIEEKYRPRKEIGWNILQGGNMPPNNKGKHWYTNGIDNILLFECPSGYRPGKIQISGSEHGHYGKKKNYQVKGNIFKKGHISWSKGKKIGPRSEKTGEKISKALKAYWKNNTKGPMSVETKKKISNTLKKKMTNKIKEKLSANLRGKTWKIINGKRIWMDRRNRSV